MLEKEKPGHRERIRESFLKGNKEAQTDERLLELLLTYAVPRKDVMPLAKKLIDELGGLSNVLAADIDTLCRFKGIGENSAALLKLTDSIRSRFLRKGVDNATVTPKENTQATLFDFPISVREPGQREKRRVTPGKAISRKGTGLFGKAVLKETIDLLPTLHERNSIEEIREHLRKNLHYSAEQTRQRYANYIIKRMFPNAVPDTAMQRFSRHFRKKNDLREVCFYRFIKAEPLMQQVVEDVLLPNLGNGRIKRERIRDYLTHRFPSSKSIIDCGKAIVDALVAGGIAKADRTKLSFSYRDIPISAFAFILHSEFPEPGMYNIAKLEENKSIKAMLWNPDRVLPALYELRNRGLISKISEIDNVRQFTVRWNLDQLVEQLTDARKRI
jgi:DNA repair protein RadC